MLIEAQIWTVLRTDKGNAVLVKPVGTDRAVPIFIGRAEAESILFGLVRVKMPRPLTHDLLLNFMEKSGTQVERVEITELKERTFYSRILIKQGLKRIVLDARPSDSLGLASRLRCPVFIAESIIEEVGVSVSLIDPEEMAFTDEMQFADDQEAEQEVVPISSLAEQQPDLRTRLQRELDFAVEQENYEEAARIRDRLNSL